MVIGGGRLGNLSAVSGGAYLKLSIMHLMNLNLVSSKSRWMRLERQGAQGTKGRNFNLNKLITTDSKGEAGKTVVSCPTR